MTETRTQAIGMMPIDHGYCNIYNYFNCDPGNYVYDYDNFNDEEDDVFVEEEAKNDDELVAPGHC